MVHRETHQNDDPDAEEVHDVDRQSAGLMPQNTPQTLDTCPDESGSESGAHEVREQEPEQLRCASAAVTVAERPLPVADVRVDESDERRGDLRGDEIPVEHVGQQVEDADLDEGAHTADDEEAGTHTSDAANLREAIHDSHRILEVLQRSSGAPRRRFRS